MRIELIDVKKSFGRSVALRGVRAELGAGSRVALVGPNGSGKSTLLRAVLGLVRCEGQVLLDGQSAFSDRQRLARRLAYVPQIAPRVAASVAELVRAVASVRDLDPATITRTAARLGLDLAAIERKAFQDLSGGMKQKVMLAMGLAAPVELVVLDEPTASLDATAREQFFDLCSEIAPSATLLLCSHRLEEIQNLASTVLALKDGEVAFMGPAPEYLKTVRLTTAEVRLALDHEHHGAAATEVAHG